MDTLMEDLTRSDADSEMHVLTPEDVTEQSLDGSDEVETLRNSLREVVHDDSVRPKMQCLMMDSAFSMVTMQGEDSGIAWETTPSRCNTPWASDTGNIRDISSPIAGRPTTPGSHPAGKIIFVMDDELMLRRRRAKENQKSKAERQREVLMESCGSGSGRPELVSFSEPNVKREDADESEEQTALLEDKEQRLFRLVSEGSEILNIVVPPKVVTVDEEESKEMVDNLSYLEETPVPKAAEEIHDNVFDFEPVSSSNTPAGPSAVQTASTMGRYVMDPPGAPVARPPMRGAASNVDYFEAYTLIDAQAPGSPAVIAEEHAEPKAEAATGSQDAEKSAQVKDNAIPASENNDRSDTISLEEITSELLDEVFYGGTEQYMVKNDTVDGSEAASVSRLPSKPSGSKLFGSQEDMLTPIFLPEGPPKIIDPILLEEPKAMAFLYTDLYEEAIGSRQKEEDTESVSSEKSFHSRHSDREARGYLEKYSLIDETPVVEGGATDSTKEHTKEGPRVMSQELYESSDFLPKPDKIDAPNSEEEITDFFRSSANSSPCDIDPFPRTQPEDETPPVTKSRSQSNKKVTIAETPAKIPAEPLSVPNPEFPLDEPDWGSADDHPMAPEKEDVNVHTNLEMWKQDMEVPKPVAPPRKKAPSAPKSCLDLTPLTPVNLATQENEEAGVKEQKEEEKETASPSETADEGEGEETSKASCDISTIQSPQMESVKENNEISIRTAIQAVCEEKETQTAEIEQRSETVAAAKQTEADNEFSDASNPGKQADNSVTAEPVKEKGHCVIL